MAKWICTAVENNYLKNRHLKELKENVRTYGYPEKTNDFELQRDLTIPQKELSQPKANENNNLTFINILTQITQKYLIW